MNSGKVRSPAGPWRRGGGNGHPQGEGGKHHKQFIPGKDGKREQIVWQSERESGVINGRRNHEREENMVAKCTEFCPLDEKRMRTKEKLLHRLECGPGLEPVKEFSRPAAGQSAPTSVNIRTPDTLRKCTKYLLHTVMDIGMKASISLADLYDFIFDRLRAVRQDLTLQQTEDVQILAACVRFHLLFGHLLELHSPELFSAHINLSHQLDCVKSCLLIGENSRTNLKEFCSKVVMTKEEDDAGNNQDMKTVQTAHEVLEKEMEEMGAIYLLSNLDSPSALAWALVQPFSNLLRTCKAISSAFLQGNYVRFFKLVRLLSPTLALATSRHCTLMAKRAIKVAAWGYTAKTARYPLQILEELLWTKQANQLCKLMGQTVDQDVVRWNKLDLQEPEMSQNEVLVSTHHGALGELLQDINLSHLLLQGWGGEDEK